MDPSTIFNNDEEKGPGWQTVSNNEFTKFTMRRSPAKKYIEPGTSVIYMNTKVGFTYTVFESLHFHRAIILILATAIKMLHCLYIKVFVLAVLNFRRWR